MHTNINMQKETPSGSSACPEIAQFFKKKERKEKWAKTKDKHLIVINLEISPVSVDVRLSLVPSRLCISQKSSTNRNSPDHHPLLLQLPFCGELPASHRHTHTSTLKPQLLSFGCVSTHTLLTHCFGNSQSMDCCLNQLMVYWVIAVILCP